MYCNPGPSHMPHSLSTTGIVSASVGVGSVSALVPEEEGSVSALVLEEEDLVSALVPEGEGSVLALEQAAAAPEARHKHRP